MEKNIFRKFALLLVLTVMFILPTGCSQSDRDAFSGDDSDTSSAFNDDEKNDSEDTDSKDSAPTTELYVTFGDSGSPFTMHLYDNETAAAIAKHVGTADWRLPLYNYEDYDNWEVMQYYDIPSRYEIPSNPESVTSEKSGTVYYSEPNRIVLFFGDAVVSGDYTPVGYFDATDAFVSAVQDNPVLEGWDNKIIKISENK